MSQKSSPPEKNPYLSAFNAKALTVGGEVGCLTLIIVLASVFGGIALDKLLGTKPLFTVGLVLLSAPLALVLTVYIAKRAVKDLQPPADSQESKTRSAVDEPER
jgi:hypothetical protein